jgi:hypothetical protein
MDVRALFAAALLACSSNVHAFTILPAAPTPQDMLVLEKPNDNEGSYTVSMTGSRITVAMVRLSSYFPEPPPGNIDFPIGKLPAGTYTVEATIAETPAGPAASLGTSTVTVAARAGISPVDDYTDLWWNPAESGWGLNFAQHPSGQAFATWFVYGADGLPLWYVVPGGKWLDGTTFQGDVYATTGPDIGAFDPARVTRTRVGNATFFFGLGGMAAVITVDGNTTNHRLVRQSF